WLSFVVIGSLALHIAVKLPAIQRGLSRPPDAPTDDEPVTHAPGSISRRGLLVAAAAGAGIVGITTLGQTARPLEPVALLAPRKPSTGPQGVPINKTAQQASITDELVGAGYRLTIEGPSPFELTMAQLEAFDADDKSLPIACVEGWSRGARWRGPRLLDLVRQAGGDEDSRVRVISLQPDGSYRDSWIVAPQLGEALLATHINGERLNRDHGYPLRLIAPNRAGVLQTKWITSIEVDR
ncbi:MAG: oxidoreductase molybdopterin binding protein, partial [Pseudonocardiales bacterium]|nr:oxidoreductase molybdopterin binding protein [Pseudonocardiales bacterium]